MALPYPTKVVLPFDIATAQDMNERHANDVALANGSGIDWATYTDWSTSMVLTGWSSTAAKEFFYLRIGNIVFFYARVEGTSNSTTTTMSLPVTVATANATTALVLNNGNWSAGSALISSTNNNVSFLTATLGNLSATGTKGFRISGFYFA